MTKRQVVSKMKAAGIDGDVTGSGLNWEVELVNETAVNKFRRNVCKAGGYKTGYGSWILQSSCLDMGDYNDRSSRWHY